MKKILIISNNCLSFTSNNGKTLKNIFNNLIEEGCVCNLYFSYENKELNIPSYNINEKKLLHIETNPNDKVVTGMKNQTDLRRLLRELIWLLPSWKKNVATILKTNNIGSIFLLAGDSIFAYRVTNYIMKKFNLPLLIYYTDDYYLKKYKGVFGIIRKWIVRKNIKRTVQESRKIYVISPKMKNKYDEVFNVNSKLLGISPNPNILCDYYTKEINRNQFLYIGNLGIGRFEIIYKFCTEIEKINKRKSENFNVKIFSNTILDKSQKELLMNLNSVTLSGGLNEGEVYEEISKTDYLIFVESFDKEMVEITKYSFSTKIMEYLAFNKNIITIGPLESSSIELLSHVSIYLDKNDYTYDDLYGKIKNKEENNKNKLYTKELYDKLNNCFSNSKEEIKRFIYENYNK